jgi:hypothetical protein
MFWWKNRHQKVSNTTAGKTKGENCQADWMKKYYFTAARAYRDPQYTTYCKLSRKLNKLE